MEDVRNLNLHVALVPDPLPAELDQGVVIVTENGGTYRLSASWFKDGNNSAEPLRAIGTPLSPGTPLCVTVDSQRGWVNRSYGKITSIKFRGHDCRITGRPGTPGQLEKIPTTTNK